MTETSALNGKEVALTGRLVSMSRAAAMERILHAGGLPAREPGPATHFLVAGEAAGHVSSSGGIPRNLKLFGELKKKGSDIRLIDEQELLRLLGDEPDLADFSRLYTAAQVSRIVDVPLMEVRSWIRKGLLQPARVGNRLAWFDFKEILNARSLGRLAASGVPPSKIHQSLSEIARWLPGGDRIVSRLESYARGLRVRLTDGGWAEPTGQRLIDFEDGNRRAASRVSTFPSDPGSGGVDRGRGAPASPTCVGSPEHEEDSWFCRALEAEEQGDLGAAAEMYAQALSEARQPEALFNLGNVLYELGRDGDAAERYLQAIEADHDFAEAWNNLGNALVVLGKLKDAVHAYEMALSLEPEYPEPHCNLATVLERMERYREALLHRTACQKTFPSQAHLVLLRQPAPDDQED